MTRQLSYSCSIPRLIAGSFCLAVTIPIMAQQVQPPPIDATVALLGREATIRRIDRALEYIGRNPQ